MRPLLVVAALFSLVALPADAQDGTARGKGGRPRPEEGCGTERVETVLVSDSAGASGPHFERIAGEVNYWFRPASAVAVRNTSYAVSVSRSGIQVVQREPAGDSAFDRATRQAVDAAAHEHAFDALAPDSAGRATTALVFFGSDVKGRQQKFTRRRVCDAWPMPSNPAPMFPLELTPPPASATVIKADQKQVTWGEVVARFLVDSSGVADPKSFVLVSSTHPLFVREVQRVLPLLRFYPAEIAGRAAPEVIEQRFEFRLR